MRVNMQRHFYFRKLCFVALVIAAHFFTTTEALCLDGNCKVGDMCVKDSNCAQGLHCETCLANGHVAPRCTRIQPSNPLNKVKGLPFNKYSWLTTHNSFAIIGEKSLPGTTRLSPSNQQDSITSQLNNGVRGLMLDMYDFMNDIWLCHSFGGNCYNFTAYQPALNTLKEVEAFLAANPSEIVSIFIEDYVTSPQGLTKVFTAADLKKYWFPVNRMPKNGEDWPLVSDMIAQNQRLVVFTSKSSKEASEGIAYEWRYLVENQYGNGGMKAGSCPNRAESSPMNTKSRSLVLQNYFPDDPDLPTACRDNSAPLISMMNTCYKAAGDRWPNFIAVDFYKVKIEVANATMGVCSDNSMDPAADSIPLKTTQSSAVSVNSPTLFSLLLLLQFTHL
ncbi:PI-PLC X domain-containing protein At5g67130 [Amborella trichopoda]|uniref:PI-PLC X domain-containing protein At5g67130 n=1 Tax=Amborella trichopoda TaxID=13333 RepID=UPI0009BF53BC|nr:PI-PLC X domain-containing protein At5g67130 [Amborella trichopoda]|eukprot:XP_020524413.1 PI-PLC X domain-containing protein At5g67130 [Amborella trichopoda]